VNYRTADAKNWRPALPLWFDKRNQEYRGSIVHLKPNTNYEIELNLKNIKTKTSLNCKTWTENFPIAKTIHLPERSSQTLIIEQSGKSDGYILYTPQFQKFATIDVENQQGCCIIVQRNHIHHPRGDSNTWREHRPRQGKREPYHPEGAQAVYFRNSLGNHVIRYNRVFSDDDHQYNDIYGASPETPHTPGYDRSSQTRDGHEVLFFEHEGGRAVRIGDWKLVALSNRRWELYKLARDRTETNNLADRYPDKVEAMRDKWQRWARKVGLARFS